MRFVWIIIIFLIEIYFPIELFAIEENTLPFIYPQDKTYEEILSALKSNDKLGFFYFTLEGCGFCKLLQKEVFGNEEARTFITANFIPIYIDIYKDSRFPLINRYNINAAPTIMIINHKDNLMGKIVGYGGLNAYKQFFEKLKDIIRKADTLQALREQYESDPDKIDIATEYANELSATGQNEYQLNLLENIAHKIEKPDQRKSIYSDLLKIYNRETYLSLTLIDPDKAIEILREGLNNGFFKEDEERAFATLANIYYFKHDYEKAVQCYEKISESYQYPTLITEFNLPICYYKNR